MKFGLNIPGMTLMPQSTESWEHALTPQEMLRVARKADELGFDWLAVPEHVVILDGMVEVLGARWPHAIAAMAFFAGATARISLVNSVVVVGYHHPIELAKMYSTVDFLSGGRLIVGLGVGYLRREFAIMHADHTNRGAIANEAIDAMIELWTSDKPSFQGQHYQFERIAFEPKPVQKPYPPIWIGGHSGPSMRRAARVGDGWWPWQITRAQLPEKMGYIRTQPGFDKRTRPFDIVMPLFESKVDNRHNVLEPARVSTDKESILQEVGQMERVGVTGTNFMTTPTRSLDEYLERLERFAEDMFPTAHG